MKKHQITIYSTPTCHFCHLAKDFFTEKEVEYTDFDVLSNIEKRKEMVDKSGQRGVPVIVIDGKVIVGFDREKIEGLIS